MLHTVMVYVRLICIAPPVGLLGPSQQSVGEQALVAAVLGTGAAQEALVPALMGAYAAADHVVGYVF